MSTKFCSPETRAKISAKLMGHKVSDKTRKAVSESNKERFINPKDHPMYGKHHTREAIEKLVAFGKTRVGKLNPFSGKVHTQETKDRISKNKIGVKTKRIYTPLSGEVKKQISDGLKSKWQDESFAKEMLGKLYVKPNKSELRLQDLLNEKFPGRYKYVGNGQIFIGGFNPDFIDLKNKKIIELYGEYWHKGKEIRDAKRIKVIESYGYKVLIIWDSEFVSIPQLLKKMEVFISESLTHVS